MSARHLHVLTNSELNAWRRCPARWGFEYAEGLRPLVHALPLRWGDLYHCGAESGWRAAWSVGEASVDTRLQLALSAAPQAIAAKAVEHIREIEGATLPDLINADQLCEETEESAKVATWSVGHYFETMRGDLSMVPMMIEGTYEVPIPTARGVGGMLRSAGKMDLVLFDRELGRLVVQDHKGTESEVRSFEKRVELDTQLVGYVCAVRVIRDQLQNGLLGFDDLQTTAAAQLVLADARTELFSATVGAIAYNVVRRRMPAEPPLNLLKKGQCLTLMHKALMAEQEADGQPRGEVSAAAIDTLPQRYKDALIAQVEERQLPTTEKQLALLEKLVARGDTYFAQVEYFKGDDAIERWRKEVWIEARRMRAAERDPAQRTRNPLACTLPQSPTCPFGSVCLSPDDPVALTHYRRTNTRHEELEHGISDGHRQSEGGEGSEGEGGQEEDVGW